MTSRSVAAVLPAIGFSLLPSITCPACLPALASVLGAVGLTFIAKPLYLLWLNLGALVIALTLLARGEHRWISTSIGVAGIGATAVMLGKFAWVNSWIWWSGLAIFMLGSIWSGMRRSTRGCANCKSQVEEG